MRYDGKALSKFGMVRSNVVDGVRDTLNDMAFIAARAQVSHLDRVFTLRNKWIVNSIWPKLGKRTGLVPAGATNIKRMYSTSGTVSPYLEKQERGWTKKDPMVPTREARVARSHKRIIRKKFRKRQIDHNKMLRYSDQMQNVQDKDTRIRMLLAVANAINWKGQIHIENDSVLPEGYYYRRGRSLKLVRRVQHGRRTRRRIEWHEAALAASPLHGSAAQTIYNRNMRAQLSRFK